MAHILLYLPNKLSKSTLHHIRTPVLIRRIGSQSLRPSQDAQYNRQMFRSKMM